MLLTEMNKYLNQQGKLKMFPGTGATDYLEVGIRGVDAKVEDDKFYILVQPLGGGGEIWVYYQGITWDNEELNPPKDEEWTEEVDPTIGAPESLEKGE